MVTVTIVRDGDNILLLPLGSRQAWEFCLRYGNQGPPPGIIRDQFC